MSTESKFQRAPSPKPLITTRASVEADIPLVEELRALAGEQLSARLDRLFDGADDLLFEMAGRATTNSEQRIYFDTMRIVRLNRPKIGRAFRTQIETSFNPHPPNGKKKADNGEVELDSLTLQESTTLEKQIALSNMGTKAEGLHKQALFELQRRLNWLAHAYRAPIATDALQPTTICNAFASGMESLDIEFAIELVIYKLFDRCVIGELTDLYTQALALVKQHTQAMPSQWATGAPAAGTARQAMPSTPESMAADDGFGSVAPLQPMPQMMNAPGSSLLSGPFAPAPAGFPGAAPLMSPGPLGGMPGMAASAQMAPASFGLPPSLLDAGSMLGAGLAPPAGAGGPGTIGGMNAMDPMTLQSLEQVSATDGQTLSYTDGRLAFDIASAARGQAVQGWGMQQAAAYVQRAGLVGRMFNNIITDPNLPADIKPRFDQLRMSVIKTALKDVGFFANPNHPVRGLVNEVATMAATARAAGEESLRRIEDLVTQIQQQFDVAAETVRKPPENAALVVPDQAERFLQQQLEESDLRRRAIVDKVKKIVGEELHLRTLGRRIPAEARPLIDSCWAPMMAMQLLKRGPDSDGWKHGLSQLDRIVDALDPRSVEALSIDVKALSESVSEALREAGLSAERVASAVHGFQTAFEQRVVRQKAADKRPESEKPGPELDIEELFRFGDTEGAISDEEAIAAFMQPEAEVAASEPVHEGSGQGPSAAVLSLPQKGATVSDVGHEPLRRRAEIIDLSSARGEEAGGSAEDLVDRLIVPGSWFRIYDREVNDSRWLRVVTRYPDSNRVSFSDFNGRHHWFIKTEDLVEDLLAGRAGPIDYTPATKRILDRLRQTA